MQQLRIILFLLANLLFALFCFGQNSAQKVDTLKSNEINLLSELRSDSTITNPIDSILVDSTKAKSKQLIDAPIDYKAKDSMAVSIENGQQKVFLYGEANVKYGNIELTGDYIELNLETKEVYSSGRTDSTGKLVGKPHFKDGQDEFDLTSLRYNFNTRKAYAEGIITEQQDGFIHAEKMKMLGSDVFCMRDGRYTSCDAVEPHFSIKLMKGKVIAKKAIITGPAYLELEGFPIYFPILPFGYFPQNKKYSSGILIPSYGEEQNRGFFLRDGGFYWAASDFFDVTLRGTIYSQGSWGASLQTTYKRKYRYSGNFGLTFNKNVFGEQGIDQNISNDFKINWSHNQDAKANPSRNISVSVDFSTSGYDRNNSYYNQNYLTSSKSSNISYTRKFENTPFSLSANIRGSQNTRDSTVSLSLPEMTFNMSRIYPFRRKNAVGKKRFYEDFALSYSTNIRNSITTKESLLLPIKLKNWQKGINHNLPLSLPSFTLLKYLNVTPGISYNERWYFDYIKRQWVDGYYTNTQDNGVRVWVPGHVEQKRIDGFKRSYQYSYNASATTTVYGLYQMKNPNSKITAVRHKMTPSISIGYNPDFSQDKFGFYDFVQVDSLGSLQKYTYFEKGIYGFAGAGKSGSVGFSLNNNIEMKKLNTKDTTTNDKFKKVSIFDNIGFSLNYNLAADSFNLSQNIPLNIRTKIAGFDLNLVGTINPYYYDRTQNRVVNEFMWNNARGISRIGRLTNFNYSFGWNTDSEKLKNRKNKASSPTGVTESPDKAKVTEELDPIYGEYRDFQLPWTFGFNYSFNYSKNTEKAVIMQTLGFNGTINLTPKWNTTFNSGFDFEAMKLTYTTMSITRDLHCWEMSFNFSPFGTVKYYNFTINVKSAMLKDLKVNKQSSPYDNY